MKKKLIISGIMLSVLVMTSFGVVTINKDTEVYHTGTVAYIQGHQITRKEINIIKAEDKISKQYIKLLGIEKEIKLPSDIDLIKGLAKIEVRKQLVLENKVVLSDKEQNEVYSYVINMMNMFNQQLESDNPQEKEVAKLIFEEMEKFAQNRGMSMEQYINEMYIEQSEQSAKLGKLIKNQFSQEGIFSSEKDLAKYVERKVEKNLWIFKHDVK